MDTSIPPEELKNVRDILDRFGRQHGIECHDLRTRQAGNSRFVSLHMLVPGTWTVSRGHELAERIESDIRSALRDVQVITHLESLDGPASSGNREQMSVGARSGDLREKTVDEKNP